MAEQSEIKRGRGRGRPFVKGQSGNPKGGPEGRRKSPSNSAKTLLEREAEASMGKIVATAMRGDKACLKICLDRLLPVKKDSPVELGLPGIGAAATARLEEGLLAPFRCQSAEGTGRVVSKVDRNGRTRAPGGRTGMEAIADSQQK